MAQNQQPQEPKPIFRLKISDTPPERSAPTGFEVFRGISGRLDLDIIVRSTFLYMGSGGVKLDGEGRSYYTFSRRNGKLIMPGTGIKGAIRSIVEALSNSCLSQTGRRETVEDDYGGDEPGHSRCKGIRPGREADAKLCPACRLFGVTGFRGRAHFGDGVLISDTRSEIVKIGDLWAPRIAEGRKFYENKRFHDADNYETQTGYRFVEAVPFRTTFRTSLFFDNVSAAELGLLLHALGFGINAEGNNLAIAFRPKIGGGKPRCLGGVVFRPADLLVIPAGKELLMALSGGTQAHPGLAETLTGWLKEDALIDRPAWEAFVQGAKVQEAYCPRELY